MITDFFTEDERPEIDNGLDPVSEILEVIFRSLIPFLMLALAIELTIIFGSPEELIFSRWYKLKDVVSVMLAYVVYRKRLHRMYMEIGDILNRYF